MQIVHENDFILQTLFKILMRLGKLNSFEIMQIKYETEFDRLPRPRPQSALLIQIETSSHSAPPARPNSDIQL